MEAGHYNLERGPVKAYLARKDDKVLDYETNAFENGLKNADAGLLQELGLSEPGALAQPKTPTVPVCDRCHNLLHYNRGEPIEHPTLPSLANLLTDKTMCTISLTLQTFIFHLYRTYIQCFHWPLSAVRTDGQRPISTLTVGDPKSASL